MGWPCDVCTFLNLNESFLCCEICGSQRDVAPEQPTAASPAPKQLSPHKKLKLSSPATRPSVRSVLHSSPLDHGVQGSISAHHPFRKACSSSATVYELDECYEKFDPTRPWPHRSPVPYSHLSLGFDLLISTRKRLVKERVLINMFRCMLQHGASSDEIAAACYLCSPAKDAQTGGHRLRPDWEGTDVLGVGSKNIRAAILEATCATQTQFRNKYSESREASDSCLELKQSGKLKQTLLRVQAPLTVLGVYNSLLSLARLTGPGSDHKKVEAMASMIRTATGSESRWIVRTLEAHLGVGISLESSVLPALGAAVVMGGLHAIPKELKTDSRVVQAQEAVRNAFARSPDVDRLVKCILTEGIAGALQIHVQCGTPVQPMLAKAGSSAGEVLDRLRTPFTAEFKYDGQRAQIHRTNTGQIRIFSRKLDEITAKYPDVCMAILQSQGTEMPFIMDAEIVAVEKHSLKREAAGEKILPFQALSTRKRKDVEVETAANTVAVAVYAFDLLALGDRCLADHPLCERRASLYQEFKEVDGFAFAEKLDLEADPNNEAAAARLMDWLLTAVERRCEGLMCKQLDAPYVPSTKRSESWIKLKKDYLDGHGDSLDLVPIAGWRGQGRKKDWISPWLLACWDPHSETLQSVCRVMSGFDDNFYKANTELYTKDENLLHGRPANVETGENPVFWWKPFEVWEVKAADITVSPVHSAGAGLIHPSRGLSLRFPRFIRKRPDKYLEDATTAEQIATLFRQQQSRTTTLSSNGEVPQGTQAEDDY